ncbi:DUF3263 domain-containing protein [Microbacterium sp. 18062]|uniref:DUF3263 domain-containing protein n=1 Tax=Microbacterium sp. 18062 TaxID=2681410 RepID=UPI00190F2D7B|nr:DUF3263 domain-containing protein [Microbacterium sp. 18062]
MPTVSEILDFEERWGVHSGGKESAIIRELGISPVRYYRDLNRAIDTREALKLRPMLAGRLRRIRDQRRHARPALSA